LSHKEITVARENVGIETHRFCGGLVAGDVLRRVCLSKEV